MSRYNDPEQVAAREKLQVAIQEFAVTSADTSVLVLGAAVVYETSVFDDDGTQNYGMQHVVLEPGSLAQAVGMLSVAHDRIVGYINADDGRF